MAAYPGRRRTPVFAPGWAAPIRRMIAGTGVRVSAGELPKRYAGASAAYDPWTDSIRQPGLSVGHPRHAHTLLHELAHATGVRLKRPGAGRIPVSLTWNRAREEIVAELTATRVARRLGIPVSPAGPRRYIRGYAKDLDKYRLTEVPKGRTPAEASAIVRDARAAENYLMTLAEGRVLPGRVRRILERRRGRGRPVRGGAA